MISSISQINNKIEIINNATISVVKLGTMELGFIKIVLPLNLLVLLYSAKKHKYLCKILNMIATKKHRKDNTDNNNIIKMKELLYYVDMLLHLN